MALNDTLKTRILLRNDALSAWNNSSLVLAKGEVAIATLDGGELAEIRVGTGSSTWATALKLNIDASQISGIVDAIKGTAKKYQVVANGSDGNSWKLQEAPLSATSGGWTDVADSTWTVDLGILSDYATEAYVSGISSALSTDYVGKINAAASGLSAAVSTDYVSKTDFATISDDIGLSAASSSNPVVTKQDIADLAGAMHFVGAFTLSGDGDTVADAIARAKGAGWEPTAGDIAINTSMSKEYLYAEGAWIELGDEDLYAKKSDVYTKAEVNAISAALSDEISAKSEVLLEGSHTDTLKIVRLDADTYHGLVAGGTVAADTVYVISSETINAYGTKVTNVANGTVSSDAVNYGQLCATSADTLSAANGYTDAQIEALSIGDYATEAYVNGISSTLSTDYVGKIGDAKTQAYNEALSDANGYTDQKVSDLSDSLSDYIEHGKCVQSDLSGYFILDCGDSILRQDEPTA